MDAWQNHIILGQTALVMEELGSTLEPCHSYYDFIAVECKSSTMGSYPIRACAIQATATIGNSSRGKDATLIMW